MNANPQAARSRPEPVARQHHPRAADERHARALHRRVLGDRADLEPDDLRQGDRRTAAPTTTHIRDKARRRQVGRGAVLRARAGGPDAAPPTCSGRSTTPPAASTAGCRSRSRRCSPTTPPARIEAAARLHAQARSGPTSSSRFRARRRACRRSRKRSSPACRSTSRCCSRASSISPRPRPTCAASSGASRPGCDPTVASVASLFVSRWDVAVEGQGAGGAAQPPRHRHRQRTYKAYRELLASPRWQQARRRRRAAAAPALGEHRHQGSRRRPTRCTSRRSRRPTRSTPCPTRRCRPSPTTARSAAPMPTDGGDCRGGARRVRRGGHRRRCARRRSCSTRAPTPSSSRGTS